jgi:hypothetical protein
MKYDTLMHNPVIIADYYEKSTVESATIDAKGLTLVLSHWNDRGKGESQQSVALYGEKCRASRR